MHPPAPAPEGPDAPVQAESEQRLTRLPWRTYRLRTLGMGLAGLPAAVVLHELAAPPAAWAWMVFTCLLWPHLAFLLATRSRDPFKAELNNFMCDSMLAGSMVPVMHFTLLPSAALLTVATADKINTGVRGLWLRSLPAMALALVAAGVLTGWQLRLDTSLAVILACLPLMGVHTIAVSASSYRLVRKLQRQNLQLDEINRRDALTGLDSRGHWLAQAEALLAQHQSGGRPLALALMDVDHFKAINDRYGHTTGDDVLRAIADQIRHLLPEGAHAGRLGGDEFAFVLPVGVPAASAFAETLRAAVESLEFARFPGLRCSVSLGLASPPDAGLGLREWLEAADRALYEAKHGGRNRTVGRGTHSRGEG